MNGGVCSCSFKKFKIVVVISLNGAGFLAAGFTIKFSRKTIAIA